MEARWPVSPLWAGKKRHQKGGEGAKGEKREEPHCIRAIRKGRRGRQTEKRWGCKGGLGWIFLVCGVGEGGVSSKGFSRGVYLERADSRRDVHGYSHASLM